MFLIICVDDDKYVFYNKFLYVYVIVYFRIFISYKIVRVIRLLSVYVYCINFEMYMLLKFL